MVQQTGRPEAPAAVSSSVLSRWPRVSRLRTRRWGFFFILCSFQAENGSAGGVAGRRRRWAASRRPAADGGLLGESTHGDLELVVPQAGEGLPAQIQTLRLLLHEASLRGSRSESPMSVAHPQQLPRRTLA